FSARPRRSVPAGTGPAATRRKGAPGAAEAPPRRLRLRKRWRYRAHLRASPGNPCARSDGHQQWLTEAYENPRYEKLFLNDQRRPRLRTKLITARTMNTKNRNCAIPAAPAAMPPKPNRAAIRAITKNTTA